MTALNQAYRRVATRADAEAEDKSQAAPRAIIHAFFPGADTTLCGKHTAMETQSMGILRVVSCTECRSELVKVSKRNSRDGDLRIEEKVERNETPSAELLREFKEANVRQTNIERDAAALNKLRACCGYVENGSQEPLVISQDDATRGWCIRIGIDSQRSKGGSKSRSYHADGFHEVIDVAYAVEKQEK